MNLYGIVGAGGFGREVMPVAAAMLKNHEPSIDFEIVFVDQNKQTAFINQYPVMTVDEFFAHAEGDTYFNVAIAGHVNRRKMVELMLSHGAKPFNIKAQNMVELDHNEVGEGIIMCPFTTITSNAKIGKYFQANIYSYVAHDCVIGDYVTFAPNVHCNGNVIIEDNVYVGTGVIIREGTPDKPRVIGRGAILGMGAVITKDVAPNETVIGNPGRPLQRQNATALSSEG